MSRWSTLIDLEYETAHLGDLIEREVPEELIRVEFDSRCMQYFGITKSELKEQVPRVVIDGFDEWYYEEVLNLGRRHGFDFDCKALNEEISMYQDLWNVIPQWVYFGEMLIAKECGFFPTTSDELTSVKLNRDARRFEDELRRQRQRPRPEDFEREKVFGKRTREIKPGSILTPSAKGRETTGMREVQIEIRPRDRRHPHGSPKRL